MEEIDCVKVAHFIREEGVGIDKINVLIACGKRVFVGLANNFYTFKIVFVGFAVIRMRYKNHGKVGLSLADKLKEGLVRLRQGFGRGRVIIVVHYEAGKVTRGNMLCDRQFTHSAAREAMAYTIGIKRAADYFAIGVSGTGNTAALRY